MILALYSLLKKDCKFYYAMDGTCSMWMDKLTDSPIQCAFVCFIPPPSILALLSFYNV